jgi:hypothetical protein
MNYLPFQTSPLPSFPSLLKNNADNEAKFVISSKDIPSVLPPLLPLNEQAKSASLATAPSHPLQPQTTTNEFQASNFSSSSQPARLFGFQNTDVSNNNTIILPAPFSTSGIQKMPFLPNEQRNQFQNSTPLKHQTSASFTADPFLQPYVYPQQQLLNLLQPHLPPPPTPFPSLGNHPSLSSRADNASQFLAQLAGMASASPFPNNTGKNYLTGNRVTLTPSSTSSFDQVNNNSHKKPPLDINLSSKTSHPAPGSPEDALPT